MAQDPIEARLHALGLSLPAPLQVPAGARLPFVGVNLLGTRALISGHGPLDAMSHWKKPTLRRNAPC
jgi:hypothetical protein